MDVSSPTNRSPLTLFEYSVRQAIARNLINERHSHQTWANLIFGYEPQPHVRSELMSIVKREFPAYFDGELQYMFLKEQIKSSFPYLFGTEEKLSLFERIRHALKAEIAAQNDPRNKKTYRVAGCESISKQDGQFIYKAQLTVEEGDNPHLTEGMPFDFKTQARIYRCEVVEYDYANALLFFSCGQPVYVTHGSRVFLDATMNIIALLNLLKEISPEEIDQTQPLYKFLNDKTRELADVGHGAYAAYLDEILRRDESQFKAFKASLDKDITFIWGPPGTGKSYTLSAIIMALYGMEDERTAVCCLSNVAVDQLVNKVVDIIEVHEPEMTRGQFYRAGRTQDQKLINTEFLFPDDDVARRLRLVIRLLSNKIEKYRNENRLYSDEAIKLKATMKDKRAQLKAHTDYLIDQVKVVFSTISNFVLNTRLKTADFDNLIVDEASMLALPQLIALASRVKKRIILVGDFQQLSPITTAGVPMLRNSVFKWCGIDIEHTGHPALHLLLNQRRSHPKLVDIINRPFYAGLLVAQNNKNHPIVARAPYSGCVVGMRSVADGAVRFTKGGTRQNTANAEAVLHLLDLYHAQKEETFSIGVITPYKGQVALLKARFIERDYEVDFQDRVRIGTVHTFQGSECDVIIFDMVDCSRFEKGAKTYFGRIYAGEQGEQLLNVAISRARHKLIVVGEPDYLLLCPGGVISDKSKSIFNRLLKFRWTKE